MFWTHNLETTCTYSLPRFKKATTGNSNSYLYTVFFFSLSLRVTASVNFMKRVYLFCLYNHICILIAKRYFSSIIEHLRHFSYQFSSYINSFLLFFPLIFYFSHMDILWYIFKNLGRKHRFFPSIFPLPKSLVLALHTLSFLLFLIHSP